MEIKERILLTAERLFFKCGIRSITMDDIAGELGISKKTIYQNFEDKDQIVYEGAVNSFENDRAIFDKIHQESENPIDEMVKTSDYLRQSLADIHPTLLHDFKKYYPKVWELFKEHKRNYIVGSIQRNIEEGIKLGFYRQDIDADLLAILRMESVEIGFDEDIFPKKKFQILDIQLKLIDFFIHGIVTEKGLKLYQEYKNK